MGNLRSLITEIQTDTQLLKGEQEEIKSQQTKLNKDIDKLRNAGKVLWYTGSKNE